MIAGIVPRRSARVVSMLLGALIAAAATGCAPAPLAAEHPSSSAGSAPPAGAPGADAEPLDPGTVTTPSGEPSVVIADRTVTDTLAMTLLLTLRVKPKASKAGYDRERGFGEAWLDVDRNGCDTRNDILQRDLKDLVLSGDCRVVSGTLADPYTATTIDFVRGASTSWHVQIDHVVALANAWQDGAQELTAAQRISLANDPLNLLAVDGSANAQKGDKDAASWLPANTAYRCPYVARQVSVKATYNLWVTPEERDAIARVLEDCPAQKAASSAFAPAPAETSGPAQPGTTQPGTMQPGTAQPSPAESPVPKSSYENCTEVWNTIGRPISAGDPGYSVKLDRDGDGVGCEGDPR